jgi:perosamine synthetase
MIKDKYKIISSEIVDSIKKISKKKKIMLHEPLILKDDFLQVKKCLQSASVSTASRYTIKFEQQISRYTKSKYSIALINGTAALQIAIKTLNIKKNEEILIPNLNYIASTNATLYCGAIPHFIDIELENFGVNVEKLKEYIQKKCELKNNHLINKTTKRVIKAIIPTHIFGSACNIDKLLILCKEFKLKVIEDASECLGSFYKDKHLGTFGDIGVLSFNGNKIITTGGGGAILTQKIIYYKKALKLATIQKKTKNYWEYDYYEMGFNYRLPGLNSSLGLSQLKKIKKILNKKKKIAEKFMLLFKNSKHFKFIIQKNSERSNFWLNNIFINNSNISLRNKIIKETIKKKIFIRPVWKLMHKINYLSSYPKMDLTNSIFAEKSLVSLPSSPNLLIK